MGQESEVIEIRKKRSEEIEIGRGWVRTREIIVDRNYWEKNEEKGGVRRLERRGQVKTVAKAPVTRKIMGGWRRG